MPAPLRQLPAPLPCAVTLLLLATATAPAAAPPPPPPVPTHPVIPGFERFYAEAKADADRGGRLLLGELNCTSCHKPDAGQAAFLTRRQAPILDGVAGRVKRIFLRQFLRDPQAVKPGTAMPNLLAGLPAVERDQRVEELVHFLATTGALREERIQAKLVPAGRDLYHKIGCVACHGSRTAGARIDQVLATSVPLGDLKVKYSPASLAAFLANPHQSRPSGRMPGLLQGPEAQAVAAYLLQGAPSIAPQLNLSFAYYEGSFDRLPDFARLKPKATGQASGFDLGVAQRSNDFALVFEGYLQIDRDGDYRFHLNSDDGSRLVLDGKQVVSVDGVHPPQSASGQVRLKKGMHKLSVAFFNGPGGAELHLEIEGPGLGRQPAESLVFLTPDGPARPGLPGIKDDEHFPIDRALAEKGRLAFASLGCAGCHQLHVGGMLVEPKLKAAPLAKLRPGEGCLSMVPGKGVPHFGLSDGQRTALAAALKWLAHLPDGKPGPAEVIARSLTAFNCYACHDRDKVGGPEQPLDHFFLTTQPEMGEEARVPPSLTGVGAKLTPAWLQHVLADGAHDRPYMVAHMPRFGAENIAELVKAFAAADTVPPVPKVTFKVKPAAVKKEGRHMVGAAGSAFGCIKCHTFAHHKAEGVQGIDMTLMARRLNHDWFHKYLLDPQKHRPGTRMPTAWPGGVSTLPDVLGGEPAQQIEAIWLYLSDGDRAQLPPGLRKGAIPLVPETEAIVYRNFIEGAGPRGIGVGYPEKLSLAFDANDLRLALLWQGAFIDAARHWTDRGAGYERPLGDDILQLPSGVSFAVLDKEGAPWPTTKARQMGYQFHGYRLTRDQRPTFLYTIGDVKVEDFPNAVAAKEGPLLRRTLALKAERPTETLWFRAAVADKIEPAGAGWYRINGEWRMHLQSAGSPQIRQSAGKQELLVPVRFHDGRARIIQEFVW
jgi:mono/diheme cytochrome c family protein